MEHLLWRSILQGQHNPLSSAFLSIATRRLQAFEESVVAQVNGVLALSEGDASAFRHMFRSARVKVVAIGVPSRNFEPLDSEGLLVAGLGGGCFGLPKPVPSALRSPPFMQRNSRENPAGDGPAAGGHLDVQGLGTHPCASGHPFPPRGRSG